MMHKKNLYLFNLRRVLLTFIIVFLTGFATQAEAKLCPGVPGADDGFSVNIVYCTKAVIADALNGTNLSGYGLLATGYLPTLLTTAPTDILFTSYLWCMIMVSLTLFGGKVLALGSDELLRESAGLLCRIAFVLFCWNWLSAPTAGLDNMYITLTNVLDELIGWIGVAFNFGIISCGHSTPDPSYAVWANFDCIFYKMLSINGPGAEAALATGVIAMILAALFAAPVGIAIIMMGLTIFFEVLRTLARALYTLLLSYMVLAILVILGPVVLPMFVFNTNFTKEVFWKWVGMICSTIFQPLFVVGFLSFFVLGVYEFIDSTDLPCAHFNSPGPDSVCSFKQIFTTYCVPSVSAAGVPKNSCISKKPLWKVDFNVSWNAKCKIGAVGIGVLTAAVLGGLLFFTGIGSVLGTFLIGAAVGATLGAACLLHLPYVGDVAALAGTAVEHVLNAILNMIARTPHLDPSVIMQFFTTLASFLVFILVMKHLMEVIPHMSREITMSVGLGLLKLAQVPFENAIASGVKGMGDQMKYAAKEKALKDPGGMKGMASRATGVTGAKNAARMPGVVASGAKGGASAVWNSLIRR